MVTKALRDEEGSVLMEYVVVVLAIAVPMFVLWHTEIYNAAEGKYVGYVGLSLQSMFQRVLSMIALPIP